MRLRRLTSNAASAIVGAVVGAVVVLAVDGATRDLPPQPPARVDATVPDIDVGRPVSVEPKRTILLAWAPGGLPSDAEGELESMPSVISATTLRAGLDWLESSRTSDGVLLDPSRKGLAIPFEVAIVEPREYAEYVPPSERESILALGRGHAVLSQTESELRGAGSGLKLHLRGGNYEVTSVVSDVTTQGYEALLAGPVPDTWQRVDRFVLMRVKTTHAQKAVRARLSALLAPGQALRIRAQGETPFLRYGDAVLPQLHIKSTFGEFAAAPRSDGRITVQPTWHAKNITSRRVPILGTVTCHRGLFPQLIQALHEVADDGLAFTIDPKDFGGCYSPRFIDSNPGGRLSHHSWGIAIDLNVAQNRPGTRPDLDPRLVRIFEANGFTWGGRWLVPDGMHFEWVRFP